MAFTALIRSRTTAVLGVLLAFATVALLIRLGRPADDRGHLYPVPGGDDVIQAEVLNGTARPGLARVGARDLRRLGVDVVFFGTADTTADSTKIILRRGSRDRADQVRKLLGTGKIEIDSDSTRRVDVTVIIGGDWKGPVELHP